MQLAHQDGPELSERPSVIEPFEGAQAVKVGLTGSMEMPQVSFLDLNHDDMIHEEQQEQYVRNQEIRAQLKAAASLTAADRSALRAPDFWDLVLDQDVACVADTWAMLEEARQGLAAADRIALQAPKFWNLDLDRSIACLADR